MKIILIIGSIVAPVLLLFLQKAKPGIRVFFNLTAVFSALVFGDISSIAIYEIIRDKTVFMTNIHALFLNPLFLMTGAYLGIYFIYRILLWTIEEMGAQ